MEYESTNIVFYLTSTILSYYYRKSRMFIEDTDFQCCPRTVQSSKRYLVS